MVVALHGEDMGLYAKWFRDLIHYHCGFRKPSISDYLAIRQHARMGGHEVDLFVKCRSGKGRLKTILIEFKELDVPTVVNQALERRGLANYVYIAVDMSVPDILGYFKSRNDLAKILFDNGIGVISMEDNLILVRAYSRGKEVFSSHYTNILSFFGDDE